MIAAFGMSGVGACNARDYYKARIIWRKRLLARIICIFDDEPANVTRVVQPCRELPIQVQRELAAKRD